MPTAKYLRGGKVKRKVKGIRDRRLQAQVRKNEERADAAAQAALRRELLHTQEAGELVAEGAEETWEIRQDEIGAAVDMQTKQKMLDLRLDFGPYRLAFTRNGRWMAIGGRKGHIAVLDWTQSALATEIHVKEAVRDITYGLK